MLLLATYAYFLRHFSETSYLYTPDQQRSTIGAGQLKDHLLLRLSLSEYGRILLGDHKFDAVLVTVSMC